MKEYLGNRKYAYFTLTLIYLILSLVLILLKLKLRSITLIYLTTICVYTLIHINLYRHLRKLATKWDGTDSLDELLIKIDPKRQGEESLDAMVENLIKTTSNKVYLQNRQLEEKQLHFIDQVELWVHEVKLNLAAVNIILDEQLDKNERLTLQFNRLENNIQKIVGLTRVNYAKLDIKLEEVSLNILINNVIMHNFDMIQVNKIKVETIALNQIVIADKYWFEFMLNQVLNNALKYGASKISIYTEVKNQELYVYIKDDGCGVEKNELMYLSERGFIGTNCKGVTKSTGLGLYLVEALAEKQDMRLNLTSEKGKFFQVGFILKLIA